MPLVPGVAVAAALPCFQHTLTSTRRKKRLPSPLFLFGLRSASEVFCFFLYLFIYFWMGAVLSYFVLNKVLIYGSLSLRDVIWCIFSKHYLQNYRVGVKSNSSSFHFVSLLY